MLRSDSWSTGTISMHSKIAQLRTTDIVNCRASSVLVTITLKADNQGNTAIYQQVQRPVRVPLPHSIYNDEEDSTCLFVKTEDVAKVREMVEEGALHVAEVFSMTQVRKELHQFAERKKVLANHTHFFCDDRITPHLYNSLGKVFLGYATPLDTYIFCDNLTSVLHSPSARTSIPSRFGSLH